MPTIDATGGAVSELARLWSQLRVIDLSHHLEEGMPTYPTHAKFFQNDWVSMGDPAHMNQLTLSEHTGTHVDAPNHFPDEGSTEKASGIDAVELTAVVGRARCLHVDGPLEENGQLGVERVLAFETSHGTFDPGDIVLVDFGWAERWRVGQEGFEYLNGWPGLGRDAAELLVERRVSAVGTDCISLDAGDAGGGLPAHKVLLSGGVLIFENLNNLVSLREEAFFIGMPLKIRNGTGSPVRAIALVAP